MVTHKSVESIAQLHLPAGIGKVAHWGAVDGLNDFQDCNKAVLFGLSYRDPTWSPQLYFALRGMQPDEWFKSAEAKEIKHNLVAKSLAAQVIQALGRPRSRQVSDEQGNCLPTTVYLTLPNDSLGRSIERYISEEFPGVQIGSWDFQLDGPTANGTAAFNLAAAVVTYMKNRQPGKYAIGEIALGLGLDALQKAALRDGLKKKRTVYLNLKAAGVDYVVEGRGGGARTYLVKRG